MKRPIRVWSTAEVVDAFADRERAVDRAKRWAMSGWHSFVWDQEKGHFMCAWSGLGGHEMRREDAIDRLRFLAGQGKLRSRRVARRILATLGEGLKVA